MIFRCGYFFEVVFKCFCNAKFLLNQNFGSFCSELVCYICSIMNSKLEIDQELFCEMMKFYGETLNLPPLSAKIYAYLIFDFERKGICFEEFVEVFSASKSSVSSNLNLLLNADLIIDFTKINERKRFFKINENYIQIRFTAIISRLKKEVEILDKLNAYRNCSEEHHIQRFENYKSLLSKNIQNIEETIHKI